ISLLSIYPKDNTSQKYVNISVYRSTIHSSQIVALTQFRFADFKNSSDPLRKSDGKNPARTSSVILNRYGESGQSYPVPDFSGIALFLSNQMDLRNKLV
ncbi:hypothetical protein H671_2g6901, partial [Cricetulus griseus]